MIKANLIKGFDQDYVARLSWKAMKTINVHKKKHFKLVEIEVRAKADHLLKNLLPFQIKKER